MILASREFVCVRPQTYENAEESKVLTSILNGPNGLQNTTFALLDPNGEQLTRGSRSPGMTFKRVERFVDALEETSDTYKEDAKEIQALPILDNLRLALNVAAADLRPLVVVRAKSDKTAQALAQMVAKTAWSKSSVGRFHYVVLSGQASHEGFTPELGVTVVQPEAYGRGGKTLTHVATNASNRAVAKALADGLQAHSPADKEYEQHVRDGLRKRITWETETRDTDRKPGRKNRGD